MSDASTWPVRSVGDTASEVRRTFQTTHGCRPISAVHHPAIVATSARNTVATNTHRTARGIWVSRRFLQYSHPTTPINGNRKPRSIIAWYAWNVGCSGAHTSLGNCVNPGTVAWKLP